MRPLRPLALRSASGPGRARFLSAASGLVSTGGEWCVIADDELHLGRFAMKGGAPGSLFRLFPGQLPRSTRKRKRRKPDLEVLLRLPASSDMPNGGLLALGSGSRPQRRAGALVALDGALHPAGLPQAIDAAPLLAQLASEFGEVNIEGGWVQGNRFHLLQRAIRGKSPNAIVGWALAPLLRALKEDHVLPGVRPLFLREMPLGEVDGVPIGFTDGTPLPDGGWMFSAVAEDTGDAYHDGALAGAFVGHAGPRHGLRWLRRIAPSYKIEGIEFDARPRSRRLLLVSDADDPQQPSWLLEARPD